MLSSKLINFDKIDELELKIQELQCKLDLLERKLNSQNNELMHWQARFSLKDFNSKNIISSISNPKTTQNLMINNANASLQFAPDGKLLINCESLNILAKNHVNIKSKIIKLN